MRITLLSVLLFTMFFFFEKNSSAQTFLNGDFEINTGFCIINGGNGTITTNLANSNAYGPGNEIDLMDNGCGYGTAYSGDFFLCIANSSGSSPDAITLQLSAPLISGQAYTIYYQDRGYDVNGCCPPGVPIEVGVSTLPGNQGTVVYTSPTPSINTWSLRTINFVAPNNGQYISFQAQNNNTRWTHIDCVSMGINACCATYLLNTSVTDATCNQSNGQASVSVSGAGGSFTYSWDTYPVQTTDTAFNIPPGSYTVTVTDSTGCASTATIVVGNQIAVNPVIIPPTSTICAGDSVLLHVTGATTYSWLPATGLSSTTDSLVWAFPSVTTTYTVTGSYLNCVGDTTITITVNPIPVPAFAVSDSEICINNSVDITYTGSSPVTATYNWDFDGATILSGSGQGPFTIYCSSAGVYNIELIVIENGCASPPLVVPVIVHNPPIPTFNIAPPEICEGKMVQVYYTGNASANANYIWDFGSGLILSGSGQGPHILQYNDSGEEVITLNVSEFGCDSSYTDTLAVHEKPLAFFTVSDTTGCDSLTVHFTNVSTDAEAYYWDFGDGTTDTVTNPSKTYYPGTYPVTLIAYSSFGCADTFVILNNIYVYLTPSAEFTVNPPEDIPVYLSEAYFQFTNNSMNATTYSWDFGDSTFSTDSDPSHKYTEVGDYIVTLYAYDGTCIDSASVSFLMVDYDPSFFIPNAFTPNHDGINDVFSILGFHIQSVRMMIFNRWGELIFQSADIDTGWDGRHEGTSCEIGTYVYVADITYTNGKKIVAKGSLTLIR